MNKREFKRLLREAIHEELEAMLPRMIGEVLTERYLGNIIAEQMGAHRPSERIVERVQSDVPARLVRPTAQRLQAQQQPQSLRELMDPGTNPYADFYTDVRTEAEMPDPAGSVDIRALDIEAASENFRKLARIEESRRPVSQSAEAEGVEHGGQGPGLAGRAQGVEVAAAGAGPEAEQVRHEDPVPGGKPGCDGVPRGG